MAIALIRLSPKTTSSSTERILYLVRFGSGSSGSSGSELCKQACIQKTTIYSSSVVPVMNIADIHAQAVVSAGYLHSRAEEPTRCCPQVVHISLYVYTGNCA
jgi:hypothetical protein